MPAVSMAGIRKSLASIGAGYNQVIYSSRLIEARHELLTANNNTPYVMSVLDTRGGPVVLEVPPANNQVALFGSGIDSFEVPLVDVGPTGQDAGRGGKYLFVPPGHAEEVPTGYFHVPSPTYFVHVALRSVMGNKCTLDDAVAYAKSLRVYPLAQAAKPQTQYVDAYRKPWKTLPTYDASYFSDIAQVVNDEPAQEKDAAMLGLLASIGIQKGKKFDPSTQAVRVLERAIHEAFQQMQDYFSSAGKVMHSGGPIDNGER
jgi:hypothetical protein